jgi:GDP-mannose 6-dehydrogenase
MVCLGRDGHAVTGVDLDPHKLDLLRAGRSPIVEEGIQELTHRVVADGNITVTADVAEAVLGSDVSFVCVGTPSSSNGSQDLSAVKRVMTTIGDALRLKSGYHAVILRSTVQPGTVDNVVRPILEQQSGKRSDIDFGLGFQPEFLREGSSIADYDHPPVTIVGTRDARCAQLLREIFGHLPCEFVVTSIGIAELQKYASNAFHAVKITFANEIGRLSEASGVDGRAVMDLICKDTRLNISKAYLRPGFAFGGSCLPKDLRAINYIGKQADVATPMLSNVLGSNRAHLDHTLQKLMKPGIRRIGMIGLSFKSGTDDLRESPMVTVAERLIGKGYELRIYDPEVNLSRLIGANRRFIEETIPHIGNLLYSDCAAALKDVQAVFVGLASPQVAAELRSAIKPEMHVVDVAGVDLSGIAMASYSGACW